MASISGDEPIRLLQQQRQPLDERDLAGTIGRPLRGHVRRRRHVRRHRLQCRPQRRRRRHAHRRHPSGQYFASWTQTPVRTSIAPPPRRAVSAPSPARSGSFRGGQQEHQRGVRARPQYVCAADEQRHCCQLDCRSAVRQHTSTFPASAKLTIDDVRVGEGNFGTTPAIFTVRLQPANAIVTATGRLPDQRHLRQPRPRLPHRARHVDLSGRRDREDHLRSDHRRHAR